MKSIQAFSVLILLPAVLLAQNLLTPEQHFGHQMGAEGQIIDFYNGLKYYQQLAKQSDRILYTELGKTTDGNPFVLLTISAPENLQRIDEIKRQRHRLSDPRILSEKDAEKLAAELPAVVFHTSSIHTTEISTAQVIPELVYMLVTRESAEVQRMRQNTIILISPSANPDGQVKIKKWYDAHMGTNYEGRMPWLYHTYIGHDNNRDWVLLHFPEQRLTAQKIHNDWHPVYSHEMHQMGATGARIFVPPYQDPYDDNTSPQVMGTMAMVGTAMSFRMTSEVKGGVVQNAIFDLFTPARAYQIYRSTARILTETASANFARKRTVRAEEFRGGRGGTGTYDPLKKSWNFPLPWPGGDWKFRTMVEYQLSASMAAINLVAGDPAGYNLAQYRAFKWAVDGQGWPYAFVFPAEQHDPSSLARLLQALQRGEIEIMRANKAFSAAGQQFSGGSYVVLLRQPYGAWAKTLLEIQKYPDLRRNPEDPPVVPYDVTAQTLPMMMGVDAVQVEEPFQADLSKVSKEIRFAATLSGSGAGYLILPNSNEAFAAADALLDDGFAVSRLVSEVTAAGADVPAGAFWIAPHTQLSDALKKLASKWHFSAIAADESVMAEAQKHALHNPRIGLYEPWGGVMDAGWTRHVLEQWQLENETLRHSDVLAGKLNERVDIIIFADGISERELLRGSSNWPQQYRGGLGDRGVAALKDFVEAGGMLVAFGRTSMTLASALQLPVSNALAELSARDYFAPGSLVLTELDASSPLAYGLPDKLPVMNRWGPAFIPKATTQPVPDFPGNYVDYDPRLSGFLLGPEHLQGKASIAVQQIGNGRVVLFSMAPQFRAMTHGAYKLVFNAIFWAAQSQ